ncbi:S8 family peptidase [Myroides fluvii]|uniref:S8 family peptidase n=1 Tax=Myroides fluvii TaxID=2572594 RepID=UPI00131E9209|nr:S8 family peptidase [Myroides fluvii]
MSESFKPHLFVQHVKEQQGYTRPKTSFGGIPLPERNKEAQGKLVLDSLNQLWTGFEAENKYAIQHNIPMRKGEYITVKGEQGQSLEVDTLNRNGGTFLSLKRENEVEEAIIYIPFEKREALLKKVSQYLTEFTASQKPKHQKLIDKIASVQRASIEDLWTGDSALLPQEEAQWCELWLTLNESTWTDEVHREIIAIFDLYDIDFIEERQFFPERTVVSIKANHVQLDHLISSYSYIAEIRRSEELNRFWTRNLMGVEREEWCDNVLERTDYEESSYVVTILDSGVNNDHLLIRNYLSDEDRLTVDDNWGIRDVGYQGHGTSMAGLILYPNLRTILESADRYTLRYKLESVKILPPNEDITKRAWHFVTTDAVSRAIISNPNHQRIYCMAVTATNQNDFGKPSTWSATIDSITSGVEDGESKLFVISAGNVRQEEDWKNYPESNLNLSVESPAQAWNAITVGAYTTKTIEGIDTVAGAFELSPFSTTSASWESKWPVKPEVVFEGGNAIRREDSVDCDEELELLTTSFMEGQNQFKTFSATSAATALASNFLARLRAQYPDAWVETLRGLLVHAADWTPEMKQQFNTDLRAIRSKQELLKIFGYGTPDFKKAVQCKSSYLTLISEERIQPYKLEDRRVKTNEIHYYELPWPAAILAELGDTIVKVKVTLSYFIEPNPGEKGYSTSYAYQSSALEFKLIHPTESFENFKARINEQYENPEGETSKITDLRWFYGSLFKGSIHSNYIEGAAVEIAQCNKLAVFPKASGWWKNLKGKNKYNQTMRYSLIISIETPELETDIYTPVQLQIENMNRIQQDVVI